jgi:hypothetical protein
MVAHSKNSLFSKSSLRVFKSMIHYRALKHSTCEGPAQACFHQISVSIEISWLFLLIIMIMSRQLQLGHIILTSLYSPGLRSLLIIGLWLQYSTRIQPKKVRWNIMRFNYVSSPMSQHPSSFPPYQYCALIITFFSV